MGARPQPGRPSTPSLGRTSPGGGVGCRQVGRQTSSTARRRGTPAGTFPKSGQKRVDQLFRDVQGRIVGRQVVLTVAQQDDAPKRARAARLDLQPEGILVL